jgi:hypothetical protein
LVEKRGKRRELGKAFEKFQQIFGALGEACKKSLKDN